MNEIIIKLKDIKKCFQNGDKLFWALKCIEFNVSRGDFMAIMGRSGSGKSTLMNIIGCLDSPSEGTYNFEDNDIGKMNKKELAFFRNRKIGMIFQDYSRAILPKISVLNNIIIPLVYNPQSNPRNWQDTALKKANLFGIGDKADNFPYQLSGGEKQRVAIARSLINDPVILLADEPTGNLDADKSKEIMAIFKQLNMCGMTIILITHELDIAAYASRIITLQDGLIVTDTKGGG